MSALKSISCVLVKLSIRCPTQSQSEKLAVNYLASIIEMSLFVQNLQCGRAELSLKSAPPEFLDATAGATNSKIA